MADAGAAANPARMRIIDTADSARRAMWFVLLSGTLPGLLARRCFRGFCDRPEFSSGTIAAASPP
jgi:hypothetical protein